MFFAIGRFFKRVFSTVGRLVPGRKRDIEAATPLLRVVEPAPVQVEQQRLAALEILQQHARGLHETIRTCTETVRECEDRLNQAGLSAWEIKLLRTRKDGNSQRVVNARRMLRETYAAHRSLSGEMLRLA